MSDLQTKLANLHFSGDEMHEIATCVLNGDFSNLPVSVDDERYSAVTSAVQSFGRTCAVYTEAVETRAAQRLDAAVVVDGDESTQRGRFVGSMVRAQGSNEAFVTRLLAHNSAQCDDLRAEFRTELSNLHTDLTNQLTTLTARVTELEHGQQQAQQRMPFLAGFTHGAPHVIPDDHALPNVPGGNGGPHVDVPGGNGAPQVVIDLRRGQR
mmetsp:Transcript_441/g.1229  ORF Transcript_441/g.1229 Transcript_441/m.1229 type:complete len:210 (+) Transcript_441:75-704(+)